MNPKNSHKLQPIFHRNLSIQNLYQYNNFFRRGYKQTLNFKFQCPEKPHPSDMINQNRLFTITKQLKIFKKVDLSQAEIRHNHVNQNKALSIFKIFSKISIISTLIYDNPFRLNHNNSLEKWPRILTKVRSIISKMISYRFDRQLRFRSKSEEILHLQRNIKFCPKLDSLVIKFDRRDDLDLNTSHKFERYPQRLKRLVIHPETIFQESNSSSLGHLKNLESLSLTISSRFSRQLIEKIMAALPTLPHIQEINLKIEVSENSDIYSLAFNKIASQAVKLRKLKLKFEHVSQSILQPLQNLHQLTSLTLSLYCNYLLPFLSECISNMNQLQYLKLTLIHAYGDKCLQSTDNLQDICKEISNLKQLQHLKLSFSIPAPPENKKANKPNFLLHLKNACTRKLKTFSLKCNQSNMYLDLFKMLENSNTSLQKLKIDLGHYHPEKDHQKTIISFLNGLLKIRVLEIPQLDISEKKFLSDISKAVQKMKYLEVLRIKLIQETVTKPGFFRGVVSILKKRGLKKFDYEVEESFMKTLKAKSTNARKIILGQLRRINPSLELAPCRATLFDHNSFDEEDWWEKEIIEEFACACGERAHLFYV